MNKGAAFTAGELAEMGLAILPRTRQAIEHRAKKEKWAFEEVKSSGRNGVTRCFLLSCLPQELQAAIRAHQVAEITEKARQSNVETNPILAAQSVPTAVQGALAAASGQVAPLSGAMLNQAAHGLTQSQRDCAHARMALVAEVRRVRLELNLSVKGAIAYLINQIDAGVISPTLAQAVITANARSGGRARLGKTALHQWLIAFEKAHTPTERLVALAPRQTRPERSLLEIEWLGDWLGHWSHPNKPTMAAAYRDFQAACRARAILPEP